MATKEQMKSALVSWGVLGSMLQSFSEDEIKKLIQLEVSGAGRKHMLKRLHARYWKLRSKRELTELLSKLAKA